jgi:hypothetical protein
MVSVSPNSRSWPGLGVPCVDHGSSGPDHCDPIMGMAGLPLGKPDLVELGVSQPARRALPTGMYIPSSAELQLREWSFSGSLGGCEH